MNDAPPVVEMIPIEQILILNRRSRNRVVFKGIVSNIADLGLKKPITVSRRSEPIDGKLYDLVCGQGRLEAFLALDQTDIPAIVINASQEDCYLMSLVENIARRNHSPIELLKEVSNLSSRGYTARQIATKVNLGHSYVVGILNLLKNGEERLVYAVERGRIPMSVAMEIANSDEAGVQKALCEAYEDRVLRGRKLQTVRRIIELRKTKGKGLASPDKSTEGSVPSAESLVRAYRQESDRQQLLVKRARLTESRLIFVVSALRRLFGDENFVTLLRAESLDSLPAYLAGRIRRSAGEKI